MNVDPLFGGPGFLQLQNRQDHIASTQSLMSWAMNRAIEMGLDEHDCLEGWIKRLNECGERVKVSKCGCDKAHFKTNTFCCHVPLCPRYQHNHAGRFQARAQALMEKYSEDERIRPKMVTLTQRHRPGESLADAAERMIRLRKNFARWATKNYGMVAAFGAMELSQGMHVHLHILLWSLYIPKEVLQSWLRAQDCTIRHCPHPADDRCEKCRAAKKECHHPERGGRERCNGSYMLNIEKVFDVRECIKYCCKPVVIEDPKAKWTKEQRAWAINTVQFFIATYRRHRIETYLEAREVVENEGEEDDEVAVGECSEGSLFKLVAIGYRCPRFYRFEKIKAPPPGFEAPGDWRPPPKCTPAAV